MPTDINDFTDITDFLVDGLFMPTAKVERNPSPSDRKPATRRHPRSERSGSTVPSESTDPIAKRGTRVPRTKDTVRVEVPVPVEVEETVAVAVPEDGPEVKAESEPKPTGSKEKVQKAVGTRKPAGTKKGSTGKGRAAGAKAVRASTSPKASTAKAKTKAPSTLRDIPNPSEETFGSVYKVSEAFVTDDRFVTPGEEHLSGADVVVVEAGDGEYRYDCLSGAVDAKNDDGKGTETPKKRCGRPRKNPIPPEEAIEF